MVSANQVLRNKCYAIYFELNNGPLIVGNVVYDNTQAGIGVHFTTNAGIYNNTLVNNGTDLDVSASYNRSPYDTYRRRDRQQHLLGLGSLLSTCIATTGATAGCTSRWITTPTTGPHRGTPRYVVNWCNSWYTTSGRSTAARATRRTASNTTMGVIPFFVNAAGGDSTCTRGARPISRGQGLPSNVAAILGVTRGVGRNMGALQH